MSHSSTPHALHARAISQVTNAASVLMRKRNSMCGPCASGCLRMRARSDAISDHGMATRSASVARRERRMGARSEPEPARPPAAEARADAKQKGRGHEHTNSRSHLSSQATKQAGGECHWRNSEAIRGSRARLQPDCCVSVPPLLLDDCNQLLSGIPASKYYWRGG